MIKRGLIVCFAILITLTFITTIEARENNNLITGFAASSSSSVQFETNIEDEKASENKEVESVHDPFKCEGTKKRSCGSGINRGTQECENGLWGSCKPNPRKVEGEKRVIEKTWLQKIMKAIFG